MAKRKNEDFTEQDRINMEAEAVAEAMEAEQEAERKVEERIEKAQKKAKVRKGRMQEDRNR